MNRHRILPFRRSHTWQGTSPLPPRPRRDPFIVYTSNIFAILGLRALCFLLSGVN